jgi:hypothetical protein
MSYMSSHGHKQLKKQCLRLPKEHGKFKRIQKNIMRKCKTLALEILREEKVYILS